MGVGLYLRSGALPAEEEVASEEDELEVDALLARGFRNCLCRNERDECIYSGT